LLPTRYRHVGWVSACCLAKYAPLASHWPGDPGRVPGADAYDLRCAGGEVHHCRRLSTTVTGVDHQIHLVGEGLLDQPALGHRLLLTREQQRAGQQRLAELVDQRLRGDVRRNSYADA